MNFNYIYLHVFNVIRYLIAFALLLIYAPRVMFAQKGESISDTFFLGMMEMIIFTTTLSFFLVFTELYELISVVILIIVFAYIKVSFSPNFVSAREMIRRFQIILFDFFDGIFKIEPRKKMLTVIKTTLKNLFVRNLKWVILTVVVFGYSGYLRFYDAFVHFAPPMSDSYVTLAWMKYINARQIFHDGIYPQGFHVFLSLLSKFSAVDPLFILKYTGPLNAMLTILGIWFFVYKVSGSKSSGYFAAVIYGCSGLFFDSDFIRQSATNSQEFALIFVLPTIWFLIKHFEEEGRKHLYSAFSGLVIIGYSHTLVFVFTVMIAFAVILSRMIFDIKVFIKKIPFVILAGVGASILSIIPLGIGYLLGKSMHSSSLSYLESLSSNIKYVTLGPREYIFLLGLAAIFLLMVFPWADKMYRKRMATLCCVFLSVGFFYYFLPVLTQSIVIDSRKSVLAILFLGVGAGMIHALIIKPFEKIDKRSALGIFLVLAGFFGTIYYTKPEVFVTPKMERDVSVMEYVNIERDFKAGEWMIVSQEEGYAVVLGSGFHMFVGDFIKDFSTSSKKLKYIGDLGATPFLTPDVFIFYEKNVFINHDYYEDMKDIYTRRVKEKPLLRKWLDEYQNNTGNLKIYYEDKDLIVYRIHTVYTQKEKFEQIWK